MGMRGPVRDGQKELGLPVTVTYRPTPENRWTITGQVPIWKQGEFNGIAWIEQAGNQWIDVREEWCDRASWIMAGSGYRAKLSIYDQDLGGHVWAWPIESVEVDGKIRMRRRFPRRSKGERFCLGMTDH